MGRPLRNAIARRGFSDNERFRVLVENVPEILWTVTSEGELDYANPTWYLFTGLSVEETLGSGWHKAIHPDDLPRTLEIIRSSQDGEEPISFEHRFRGADGEYRWHMSQAKPLRTGGVVTAWIGSSADITELKQAEAELRAQQQATLELSTPVLQVQSGLLIVPLIGAISDERARLLTARLLESIRTYRAKAVVIDVTGVPWIDSTIANRLLHAVEAARLLGAETVITGISLALAGTLAQLGPAGIAFNTAGDLQSGIEQALATVRRR